MLTYDDIHRRVVLLKERFTDSPDEEQRRSAAKELSQLWEYCAIEGNLAKKKEFGDTTDSKKYGVLLGEIKDVRRSTEEGRAAERQEFLDELELIGADINQYAQYDLNPVDLNEETITGFLERKYFLRRAEELEALIDVDRPISDYEEPESGLGQEPDNDLSKPSEDTAALLDDIKRGMQQADDPKIPAFINKGAAEQGSSMIIDKMTGEGNGVESELSKESDNDLSKIPEDTAALLDDIKRGMQRQAGDPEIPAFINKGAAEQGSSMIIDKMTGDGNGVESELSQESGNGLSEIPEDTATLLDDIKREMQRQAGDPEIPAFINKGSAESGSFKESSTEIDYKAKLVEIKNLQEGNDEEAENIIKPR